MSSDERRGWLRTGVGAFIVVSAVAFAAADIAIPDFLNAGFLVVIGFLIGEAVTGGARASRE